jgi:hypothetical protein
MKRLGPAFIAVLVLLSLSICAGAADMVEGQERMEFTVEQGGSVEFLMLIFNTEANDVLFPYGDIDDWVSFGSTHLAVYECENRAIDWVMVTIDIPQDAEVGEYEGGVTSNTEAANIIVSVVPPLDEIKSMQDLEEMKEELESMTDSISQELNSTKENLQDRIAEISEYQQDLAGLEAELAELEARSQGLEEENGMLTGQVAGAGTTQFVVGIIIGIIIIILYLNRKGIGKSISKARRPSAPGGEEKYRGWKP